MRTSGSTGDRVRAVVLKSGREPAWVACAIPQAVWENVSDDAYQAWKAQALRELLPEWEEFEVREVVLEVDQDRLEGLFGAPIRVLS